MLVTKNDYVVRIKDRAVFRVILADAEEFAVARSYYNARDICWTTDYGYISAFSNMESINTLEDLGFRKAGAQVA